MIRQEVLEIVGYVATCDSCGMEVDMPDENEDVAYRQLEHCGWEVTNDGKCFCRRCSRKQREVYDNLVKNLREGRVWQ